ncbi:MAG: hypothetical protein WC952_07630, partial [Desulfobulbaceae bacterium]
PTADCRLFQRNPRELLGFAVLTANLRDSIHPSHGGEGARRGGGPLSGFRYHALHADAVFAEILVGGRALTLFTVFSTAAFAGFQLVGFFPADRTGMFFLAHRAPLKAFFWQSL